VVQSQKTLKKQFPECLCKRMIGCLNLDNAQENPGFKNVFHNSIELKAQVKNMSLDWCFPTIFVEARQHYTFSNSS